MRTFLVAFISFLIIDLPWIGFIGKRFYDTWLSPFARTIRLAPALGTYLLLAVGITIFVLPQAKGSATHAALLGGILGAITYGVYDLTNYAVLTKYSLQMTLIDWAWGTLLCAVVSYIVYSTSGA
ncbi:MAG: DUF2177 family protein [Candidatus Woesebacteria bacterium]